LIRTVEILELTVDNLSREVHTLKQQQADMLEQIKRLKGEKDDLR